MNNELVSIITPSYNSFIFLGRTYESIKEQTHQIWEWIIVDDCSTDESVELINSLIKKDKRIKLIQNTSNLGPGASRNKGISLANGKYLTFIDSDDIWLPHFLETSINHLNQTNSQFVFASYERWNEDLTSKIDNFIVPQRVTKSDLLKTCSISCLTAFIHVEKLGKKYMPDLRKRQDFGLWLEYLSVTKFAYGIEEPLAKYRIRETSVSSNKLKVIKYQFEIYRNHQNLSFLKS